ncbi:MAG: hypothetical protein LBQ68_01525 [Clostridiales bacterium]|nr:hypothetical protein [Clostridiales bacterium]
MLKSLRNVLLFVGSVLATIAITNLIIAPISMSHQEFENSMAAYLVNGDTIYYKTNYNEQLVQALYIQNLDKAEISVVLGSSRSMLLSKEITSYESQYNNSVSGASFYDIVAILGMYYKRGILPRRVVIEISPWNFNDQYPDNRLLAIYENDYNEFYSKLDHSTDFENKISILSNALSFVLFQDSLETICKDLLNIFYVSKKLYTTKPDDTYYTKYPDGSIEYGSATTEMPYNEILDKIHQASDGNERMLSSRMQGFSEIGEKNVKQLNALLSWIRENEIDVTIYLSPFAPAIYEYCMSTDYSIVADVEEFLVSMSNKYGAELRGSYNPVNIGLADTDFYDCIHPRKEATKSIWDYTRHNEEF